MPKYYIQNYSKGIEVLKVIAQNNASIELKDFVREAQQKALKRRAQIKKKREKTINV